MGAMMGDRLQFLKNFFHNPELPHARPFFHGLKGNLHVGLFQQKLGESLFMAARTSSRRS